MMRDAGPAGPEQFPDHAAIAGYIAEMAGDLASLARGHGFEVLGYILDMAKLEAEMATRAAKIRR